MKMIYRRISFLCALMTGVLGTLTLIGWISGLETLASIRQTYIPMAPSTALAFTLLGMVMLLRENPKFRRPIAELMLLVVGVVAGGKLFEFFSGVSLGIEEWLVADPAMFGSVRTGRMSPITALNFLLICIAILALLKVRLRLWAGPAAAVVLGISSVVVLGYLHGTPLLYGGTIIPVALPTAAAFILLGSSIIAAIGAECWPLRSWQGDSTRAMLLRWFLPAVVLVALAEGLLRTHFLTGWTLNPALSSALSTLLYILIVTAVISQVARMVGRRIDKAESERNAAQAELESLNRELERRIAARTLELSTKNQQMEEELKMARELQLALLPDRFPSVPRSASAGESALKFFTLYQPAGAVSGDFFSVFPVSETGVGIFICDVMGHGVRAALVTSMMRALLEQHSGTDPDPGHLLSQINHGLHSILKQAGTTMYATGVMIIADAAKGEFQYAIAGHPSPLHLRRHEGKTVSLEVEGRAGALGLFADATFTTSRSSMAAGDLIMLFTDGLFEVENAEGDLYTQEDLVKAVDQRLHFPTSDLFQSVLAEVQSFSQRSDFDDDVCIIGIEVTAVLGAEKLGKETGQTAKELPSDAQAVAM
ncbi:PP2C family protein-serine/threonine phosphatase [Prosthecobacter sp.]|uniref:PP2C family protein-serine/threonine phosphatase n=1 Tax=Prosthecobacter sp. TaxID=1965333 RepID=UPI003784097B